MLLEINDDIFETIWIFRISKISDKSFVIYFAFDDRPCIRIKAETDEEITEKYQKLIQAWLGNTDTGTYGHQQVIKI